MTLLFLNKIENKTISNIFKLISSHVESFHSKSQFYSNFKEFWVIWNSFAIVEELTENSHKENTKTIFTFDFSTLYPTIPRNLPIKVLNEILSFASNYYKKTHSKELTNAFFTQESLKHFTFFLIKKMLFHDWQTYV